MGGTALAGLLLAAVWDHGMDGEGAACVPMLHVRTPLRPWYRWRPHCSNLDLTVP